MLSERARMLGGSQTSGMRNRARKLRAEGIKIVNFAAGELDQDTSDCIKRSAHQAIDGARTQYTDTLGISELRESVADRISRKTCSTYSADEVGFTAGAKQALFHAAFVAFQPGDEVLIPAPYWVTFPEQVRLAGAEPVFVPTAHNGFQLDLDALERAITPRTQGMILNTPNNPTGVVYGPDALTRVAELVLKHELTCVFDECYDELVYSPAIHHNIVKLAPEMKARTILVGSLSKTYCMAGWRAGYFAAPKPVVKAIGNLQSHTASNPCNLVQYAALAALDPSQDAFVARVREQLSRQRAVAVAALSRICELPFVKGDGAFYLFPNISALLGKSIGGELIDSVNTLAEMLLQHAPIAVVPGSAFGADDFVRISYAIPEAEVAEGLGNLERFVGSLT